VAGVDGQTGGAAGDAVLGAIVLFVALSLVYTYIGGVKAVIWTDAVQFVLFLIGGLFAICYIPALVQGDCRWCCARRRPAASSISSTGNLR